MVSMWTLGWPLSSLCGKLQFSIVSSWTNLSLFPFLLRNLGAIIVFKWTPRSNYFLCLNTWDLFGQTGRQYYLYPFYSDTWELVIIISMWMWSH